MTDFSSHAARRQTDTKADLVVWSSPDSFQTFTTWVPLGLAFAERGGDLESERLAVPRDAAIEI
jgi:hypothetical protein